MIHAPRSTTLGLLLALILGTAPVARADEAPAADAAPPAATPPSPTLSDLGRSLRSYFSEEELDLLFQYMRDSVIAAFKGEEVTLPPDLSFKLEILLVRMKKEGGHYMDNLIKQLEKDLERNLKEKLKPPDTSTSTYTPPQPPAFVPPAFVPPSPQPSPQPGYYPPFFMVPAYPQYQTPGAPYYIPPSYPQPAQTDP